MQCPACDKVLTEMHYGHILVDVCDHGCGGTWFDAFELNKVDEPHELPGSPAPHVASNKKFTFDAPAKRFCPRCSQQPMRRRFFSPKRRVEIDECPQCGGIWLDAGELERIRAELGRAAGGGALSSGELTKLTYQYLKELRGDDPV